MTQVRVALHTTDPIIRAGLTRFLQFQPGQRVLPQSEKAATDVLTVATHRLTTEHIRNAPPNAPRPSYGGGDHL